MSNTTGKKFGGRRKGTPNKSTAEIRAFAQQYGPEAIGKLVNLMRQSDDYRVQLVAAKELLDRGYGRPTEMVESVDGPAEIHVFYEGGGRVGKGRNEEESPPVIRPSGDLQIGSKV
jgi:hypothetical protein